jgi:gliding motility-associated lipoprotein GldJ
MDKQFKSLRWIALSGLIFMFSCKSEKSSITGWNYNDPKMGGFEVQEYAGQETGPGLVLVEGGTFTMGSAEQDVTYEYHNIGKRVTVPSFYLDETEIANVHYREYVYWTKRTFAADFYEVYAKTLPDSLVWREELAYNEPYVKYYFRHPSYNYYPVVGVNWLQANDFCKWRTDRVNEMIMIREGYLDYNPSQINEDNFNTESYLIGQYDGMVRKSMKDYNPDGTGERRVRLEDGIMLPDYRLPTEAEWEYAALSLIGNNRYKGDELITDRKIYPWNGPSMRYPIHGTWQGDFLANFKRDAGDYAGVAGGLNDNAFVTAPVSQFMPNDYGLYNMAGNVSEWVMDVYRPLTQSEVDDFNSFRGNKFEQRVLDDDGIPVEKDSLGRVVYRLETKEDLVNRRNYRKGDVKNYKDGDAESWTEYDVWNPDEPKEVIGSMIDDRMRVYKGGSWADEAYFLAAGTRRYLDEDQSTSKLGFRCAMVRLGSPTGNDFKSGNMFKKR